MRLEKNASGKQIAVMTKKEWTNIGKKAGWMKKASPEENVASVPNNGQIEVGDRVKITQGPLADFDGLVKSRSHLDTYTISIMLYGKIALITLHKDYMKLVKKNDMQYQEGCRLTEQTLSNERQQSLDHERRTMR